MSTHYNYPVADEYIDSIKNAGSNFIHLKHLRPILDEKGEPEMIIGNYAVVFKMRDCHNETLYAVKCYYRYRGDLDDTYKAITKELRYVQSPFLMHFSYWEDEIYVDSLYLDSIFDFNTRFPVLLMEWVEGVSLEEYVRSNCGDKRAMRLLAYRFSQMAADLN